MEKHKVANKPNNVLFAVGEHTTNLQNRIIATSLSFFRGRMTKSELEALSEDDLSDLADTLHKQQHKIPLSLLAADYDTKSASFHEELVTRASELAKITYGYRNEEELVTRTIFQEVRYQYRNDYIEIRFSHVFVTDLLMMVLNGYTPIRLEHYLKLTQEYAGKLYLQIISELTFKGSVTVEYELETFKKFLGIIDNKGKHLKNAYKRWDLFRSWVVEPAIKDINENSDIEITYTTRKKGRKINWLVLNIARSKKIEQETEILDVGIQQLRAIGVNLNKAKEIMQKYSDDEFIQFACNRSKQRAEDNPAGYLVVAIEDMFDLWEMQQAKVKAEKEAEALKQDKALKLDLVTLYEAHNLQQNNNEFQEPSV